jgi:hypothetical protein
VTGALSVGGQHDKLVQIADLARGVEINSPSLSLSAMVIPGFERAAFKRVDEVIQDAKGLSQQVLLNGACRGGKCLEALGDQRCGASENNLEKNN